MNPSEPFTQAGQVPRQGMLCINMEQKMKAFQAYSTNTCNVTRPTAKEAALAFFEMNPKKRKCNVVEGEADGHFFTITCHISREGRRHQSWKDVTKNTAKDLPGNCDPTHIPAQSDIQLID